MPPENNQQNIQLPLKNGKIMFALKRVKVYNMKA